MPIRSASQPVIGIATIALIGYAVPHLPRDLTRTVRNELSALTSLQVWLTLGVGAVGFGGMFAMYSYIAPTVTEVTGLPASAVPIFLLVFGLFGFIGNLVAGRMGDWSVIRSVVIGMAGLGIGLPLFALAAPRIPLGTLGFVIFHRTTDGVIPTREGQLILEEASKLAAQLRDAAAAMGFTLHNTAMIITDSHGIHGRTRSHG